jgi:hypothetical protein
VCPSNNTDDKGANDRSDQRKRAPRRDDLLPPVFVTFTAAFGMAFFVTFLAAALATRDRS